MDLPAILWSMEDPGPPGPLLRLNPPPGAPGLRMARPLEPQSRGLHYPPSFRQPLGEPGVGEIVVVGEDESPPKGFPVVGMADGPYYLRHPRRFVEEVVRLRRIVGPNRVLYAPAMAVPWNLAPLLHAGIDLVDGVRVEVEGALGRYLTSDGPWDLDDLGEPACPCPGCSKGLPAGLGLHNRWSLAQEAHLVERTIRRGTLRELVEKRVSNDPWCTAVLRHLDLRYQGWQEVHAPLVGSPLRAYSHESLWRPEILRFRARVKERYRKPPSAQILLLVPCSARKPYSTSKSHRTFQVAIEASGNPHAVHVVVVTSPLGIVPREVEVVYPAGHYDIPVTGDWNEDEKAMVRGDLLAYLKANEYAGVVAHLGAEEPIVREHLPAAEFTGGGQPTSPAAVEALAHALRKAVKGLAPVPARARRVQDMEALLRFQFGPVVEGFLEGCDIRGHYPNLRILRGGTQLGMLTEGRGMISLTLEGARELARRGLSLVEIEDFHPKGNVFAVGVDDAHDGIRIGDEAVVVHRGDVRGVGVAMMPGPMMREAERGEAVRMRHRAHGPP